MRRLAGWKRRGREEGPVPVEVAVGPPGCPVASAAEMKELIYQPESYNSLSTCIRTPRRTSFPSRLPHSLASFSSSTPTSPVLAVPPSLSTSSKFLVLFSSLGAKSVSAVILFLYAFRALFAWLYARIISELIELTEIRVQFYSDVERRA